MTMVEYGTRPDNAGDFNAVGLPIGTVTAGDVPARLKAMDEMGADVQMIFSSTLYATASSDPGLETALFRCYKR